MSRSNRSLQRISPDDPDNGTDIPKERYYIGRNKPEVQVSCDPPLHWHEAYLMGYKTTAWPKGDADRDDIRYDLKEKENES